MIPTRSVWSAAVVAALLAVTGCTSEAQRPTPLPPAPSDTGGAGPSATPDPGPVGPVGDPVVVASGLDAPWSIAVLRKGSALISERDSGLIKERTTDGSIREVGPVAGVQPGGEGGLLGIATLAEASATWLYAYFTAAGDNRIVRMPLSGAPGSYSLGASEPVLEGIAKAGNHNGGRIAFGPDGMLYATVGDAGQPARSQDPQSLNGKILRMTPTGGTPGDNPFAGSLVYSLGHRNPQGLAWDARGQLWAAEFGQNKWDEFNRIQAGGNYGWPAVEGIGDDPAFVNPAYQWEPSEASPSGMAFIGGTFFLAALRGERVWALTDTAPIAATPYFLGQFGRIRDAVPGPGGTLWVLTNNTDGRGTPRNGDDSIIEVQLAAVAAP